MSYEWLVPEGFTGPAFFQLDNVQIQAAAPALPAEALATLAAVLCSLRCSCFGEGAPPPDRARYSRMAEVDCPARIEVTVFMMRAFLSSLPIK